MTAVTTRDDQTDGFTGGSGWWGAFGWRGCLSGLDRGLGGPSSAQGWVGVEHEYRVFDTTGRPVDFRCVVGGCGVGVAGLDPGDGRARRLTSGAMLTADGAEAEVAIAPVYAAAGFTGLIGDRSRHARTDLTRALPAGATLEGFSTHLNVAVTDRQAIKIARRFVESHALALMLLMDRPDSPGLLVRPRRGRLEFCGEHLDDDHLAAAIVFATAATVALGRQRAPRALRVPVTVEAAHERFGYYIDRRGFGPDLYTTGRDSLLPDGRRAQQILEDCWAWTRPAATTIADPHELRLLDHLITGRTPLPLEATPTVTSTTPAVNVGVEHPHTTPEQTDGTDPFGSVLTPRHRGPIILTASILTWPAVVLDATGPTGTIHLLIPGPRLDAFLTALDAGHLDPTLHDLLTQRHRLPTLKGTVSTDRIRAYQRIDEHTSVIPPERHPTTGRPGNPNGPGSRQHKHRAHTPPTPHTTPTNRRPLILALTAFTALLLLAGVALAATSNNDNDNTATPPATEPTQPGTEPTQPGTEPTQPGTEPTEQLPCTTNGTVGKTRLDDTPTDVFGEGGTLDDGIYFGRGMIALLGNGETELRVTLDWYAAPGQPPNHFPEVAFNRYDTGENWFASKDPLYSNRSYDITIEGEPLVGARVTGTLEPADGTSAVDSIAIDITTTCDPTLVPPAQPPTASGTTPGGTN